MSILTPFSLTMSTISFLINSWTLSSIAGTARKLADRIQDLNLAQSELDIANQSSLLSIGALIIAGVVGVLAVLCWYQYLTENSETGGAVIDR